MQGVRNLLKLLRGATSLLDIIMIIKITDEYELKPQQNVTTFLISEVSYPRGGV